MCPARPRLSRTPPQPAKPAVGYLHTLYARGLEPLADIILHTHGGMGVVAGEGVRGEGSYISIKHWDFTSYFIHRVTWGSYISIKHWDFTSYFIHMVTWGSGGAGREGHISTKHWDLNPGLIV